MNCYLAIDNHRVRLTERQAILCLRVLGLESLDECNRAVLEHAYAVAGSHRKAGKLLGVSAMMTSRAVRDDE